MNTAALKSYVQSEKFWLLLILLLSASLRFWHYGSFSYSNDELSAIARAQYPGFNELVTKGFYVDGHPGGIQVFLWLWIKCFGTSPWSIRLPFVFFGIASVWFSFKIASSLFGKVSGLFAAATIGFLQFSILYSQIARPYGAGMLFSLMLVYFWLQIFFRPKNISAKPNFYHLVGFAISASLCMYTHYFSFLFALIVGLSGFIFCKRSNCLPYILSALVAAMLFVPHIYITLNHLTYKGLSGWLAAPKLSWIFAHIFYIFDESYYTLGIVIAAIVALLLTSGRYNGSSKLRWLLLVWFIMPMAIGYVYSVRVSPVLQHPVLIFSFPYIVFLIFSFRNLEFTTLRKWILAVYLLAGFAGTAFVNNYYSKQHFGEFKLVAKCTIDWCEKYGEDNIAKAASINNPYYIDFYFEKQNEKIKFDQYEINTSEDLTHLSEIVSHSTKPYFLLAITKPSSLEAEDIIRSIYPYVIEYENFGDMSSIALYSKDKGMSFAENYNIEICNTYLIQPANKKENILIDNKQETFFVMDSASEYSKGLDTLFNYSCAIKAIQAEAQLFTSEIESGVVLVVSIENPDGSKNIWQGAEASLYETVGSIRTIICTSYPEIEIPKGSRLKVYFWNKEKKHILVSNIEISTYSKIKNK